MHTEIVYLCLLLGMVISVNVTAQQRETGDLARELDEMATQSSQRLPAELIATMQQAVVDLRSSGIEKSAKQVGDAAIDAELSGWDGRTRQLSELWRQGPLVLMWYRGGWCPYCNLQLRAMQSELKAIEGAGATLAVLTPELPERAQETAKANDVQFVALHDKNLATARKYGLVFQLPESIVPLYRDRLKLAEFNGNAAMELPLSATYVIDTDGIIRYAFLDADYKKRAEPAEIVSFVRKLAQQEQE